MRTCAFFFLAVASLLSAVPQLEEASLHNAALANSTPACDWESGPPSSDDIFSVAQVKIVALYPLIGNVTSDASSPKLVWAWQAESPSSASFALPPTQNCPGGRLEVYGLGEPKLLEARLTYRYGNSTRVTNLTSQGPNPVALLLESGKLSQEDFKTLYANLTLELNGTVSQQYRYRKTTYHIACAQMGNFEVCGCETGTEAGIKAYERQVSDQRNFLVETGPVEWLWLNPPLQKRLEGREQARVALFARRMPSNVSVTAGGREIGWVSPYSFEVENGSCGELLVKSKYEPVLSGVLLNMSNETVFPFQLVGNNDSYLPLYLEFGWNESAGRKEVVLEYEDWFSSEQNFSREFFVRRPEPFSSEKGDGAMALWEGDETRTPAAYPVRQEELYPPDFSPIAVLLALPVLLAIGGIAGWLRIASR